MCLPSARSDQEAEATTFLHKACAGLFWYGLKHVTGFKFSADPTPVKLYEEPKAIAAKSNMAEIAARKGWREFDGDYDADKTTILPDHKRLFVFAAGSAQARFAPPVSILSTAMLEGIGEGRAELVLRDPKLQLACEVHLSSYFESTATASFLSRINTLEILVADVHASPSVQKMVERFITEAKDARSDEEDPTVQRELESVVSRLDRLRFRSIKSRIRSLVEDTMRSDPDIADPAAVAREVSKLYDLRSTLVHTGEADKEDITKGNNRLNDIVPRVLRVLFRQTALCE